MAKSANPTDYLKKLRKRDTDLANYLGTNCPQIEMATQTGKAEKPWPGTLDQIKKRKRDLIIKTMTPTEVYRMSDSSRGNKLAFMIT